MTTAIVIIAIIIAIIVLAFASWELRDEETDEMIDDFKDKQP